MLILMNENTIKYYLINGPDKQRAPRFEIEFARAGVRKDDIQWMRSPNKDDAELNDELIDRIMLLPPWKTLSSGCISCTYKHYLALKDIVENNYDYGVIIEDNTYFKGNVPNRVRQYISQLDEFYPGWDIIFDGDYMKYNESPVTPDRLVYPKAHPATRCAHFYLMTQACARKLYENYLPFDDVVDHYLNALMKKLELNTFWAEPSNVGIFPHQSTV